MATQTWLARRRWWGGKVGVVVVVTKMLVHVCVLEEERGWRGGGGGVSKLSFILGKFPDRFFIPSLFSILFLTLNILTIPLL